MGTASHQRKCFEAHVWKSHNNTELHSNLSLLRGQPARQHGTQPRVSLSMHKCMTHEYAGGRFCTICPLWVVVSSDSWPRGDNVKPEHELTNTVGWWLTAEPSPSSDSPWHWRDARACALPVVLRTHVMAEMELAWESEFVGASPTSCPSVALGLGVLA